MQSGYNAFRFFICLLLLAATSNEAAENGIRYYHVQKDIPLSIHIIEVDPHQFNLVPARALNDGLGRESVASISLRNGAVAAINGGFFSIGSNYDGLTQGPLKIGNDWFGTPTKERGAVGWNSDNLHPLVDRLKISWNLNIGGKRYPINGLNQARDSKQAILYTWAFHRSTLTKPGGKEVLIQDGRVVAIKSGKGDSSIPFNGYVYSIGSQVSIEVSAIAVGANASIENAIVPLDTNDPQRISRWKNFDYIVGGTPVLIQSGNINSDFSKEKVLQSFLLLRHPRTAVGYKENGTWVFVVVDGRQMSSVGMTIAELAEFMKSLGCVEALNLDGGGSSTMVYDGKVVNHPIGDEDEDKGAEKSRRVADAILVIAKEQGIQ